LSGTGGFGVAPPGLVLGGGGTGSPEFGGITGMTGCFSPGKSMIFP
jgi:hypothetical protein